MSDYEEIDAGDTLWRFEKDFFTSNWTCIWGRGCKGIDVAENIENGFGCCSLGCELDGVDEAMNLSAYAAMIPQHLFQHFDEAQSGGIFKDEKNSATRVVDGACIFLNRPGFSGGAGCALHLGALHFGESITEWKPSVCWQLPIKVDWEMRVVNVAVATVYRWNRTAWGEVGDDMAWCCTEGTDAYCGDSRVIDSLAEEISGIVGEPVFVELRKRLG